jgi:hypothetical protein
MDLDGAYLTGELNSTSFKTRAFGMERHSQRFFRKSIQLCLYHENLKGTAKSQFPHRHSRYRELGSPKHYEFRARHRHSGFRKPSNNIPPVFVTEMPPG